MKIAIPARYASTRFPGKPLFELAGKPMIQRVWQQAVKAFDGPQDVYVATDDARIADTVKAFGGQVCMTAATHENGTERLAEFVDLLSLNDDEIVINVQGDEPLIDPSLIRLVGDQLASAADAHLSTAADTITDIAALDDPNIVKVVCAKDGSAHYFSRACIPHNRDGVDVGDDNPYLRHIGIYAYRAATLRTLTKLEPAPTEQLEKLEQLRALWHGMKITVAHYHGPAAIGVDTPADAKRVDQILRKATSLS